MDWIEIKALHCYGYTGLLPEEQVLGQWFAVDLALEVDLRLAGRSDHLEDTLDYRGVIQDVRSLVGSARFALIERLAAAIAEGVLAQGVVRQVRVRLTKLAPPIPDFGGQITIEICRHQLHEELSPP